MAQDRYERMFIERINRIYPMGYENISGIQKLPEDKAGRILREIIETGCLSQNEANIVLARRNLLKLPPEWLLEHLPEVAAECLFQEPGWEEWEFRRMAEMLREHFPDAFLWWVDYAGQLNDPQVNTAIDDYL